MPYWENTQRGRTGKKRKKNKKEKQAKKEKNIMAGGEKIN